MKAGDAVLVTNSSHPWKNHVGKLVQYETYGLGWWAWLVSLDEPYGQKTYASPQELRVLGDAPHA